MRYRFVRLLALAGAMVVLTACEGTMGTKQEQPAPAATQPSEATTSGTQGGAPSTSALGGGSTFQGNPLDNPASILAKRTVYFDFDKSDVHPEDRPIIEAHAKYLAAHPSASITLEGHCDERGTREYNMALGERRANAVRQLMTLLGASGQQIKTVSYGEERPVDPGHNEAAWAKNRRVEIIYRTR